MKRFLIVGCGGSGGATLAYMMDQLRSDLADHGVTKIPRGWQFVEIDVATGGEAGPDGLGNVEQQHGRYLGIGPNGGSYPVLDNAVSQALAGSNALGSIATWAPRRPDLVGFPISTGANQFRALGRMITLSKVTEVRQILDDAWQELQAVSTLSEMEAVSKKVPTVGDFDRNDPPAVIVVSSMAGGAGASMALDVCRLLTLIPNVTPGLIGVFMVTADIFDSLPAASRSGVRANAAAMMGEIVASQAGAARKHDVATLTALGHRNGDGAPVPFSRVFPVGRFMGIKRTPFGNGTPREIYRGLGRGLAGLIASGPASDAYINYDLTNAGSPLANRDTLGWGVQDWSTLPWGSFGFASLSMGRDRYAEYAAQRLAHGCVERLLRGHLQAGNAAMANEQLNALLDSQWARILTDLQLPEGDPAMFSGQALANWLGSGAMPRRAADGATSQIVQRELRAYIPSADGTPTAQWLPVLRAQLFERRAEITAAIERAAYDWAFTWHRSWIDRVEWIVGQAITLNGLPYAVGLLRRLGRHLQSLAKQLENSSRSGESDVVALPAEFTAGLPSKGVIANGQALIDQVLQIIWRSIYAQLYKRVAERSGQILSAVATELMPSFAASLQDAQRILELAETAPVQDAGLARVASDQVPAWPTETDEMVDRRFDHAVNEVLLTTSRDYQEQFKADLRQAVFGDSLVTTHQGALAEAITQVISGNWPTTGGLQPPRGLIERTSAWRTSLLPTDPASGKALTPSVGRFDVHTRPAEIAARARAFVHRPGESFHQFCSVSLREYVEGRTALEYQITERRTEIVSKFQEALSLALPLIGVNDNTVRAIHGTGVVYRYKFSKIPFDQLPTGDALHDVLQNDNLIDQSSLTFYNQSLTAAPGIRKIDIFGSYPNYSPLVFDSVLGPAAQQWSATAPAGRPEFWQWRRSRPLAAALPMTDAERRAMTAGWLLGQILGMIRIPDTQPDRPVQIYDQAKGDWLSFPHPLLTPPSRFTAKYDWLPAVLESVMIAMSRASEEPVLSSMRPYQVLRGIFDDGPHGPVGGILVTSASRLIQQWLIKGRIDGAGPSRLPGAAEANTITERATAAKAWLTTINNLAGVHFVPPGTEGAPGGGAFSVINNRDQAAQVPIFGDVARDVIVATNNIINAVDNATIIATTQPEIEPPGGSYAGGSRDTAILIPENRTF